MARRRKTKGRKGLTRSKARQILHDKTAQGYPLTKRQRGFFGAVASGAPPKRGKKGRKRGR